MNTVIDFFRERPDLMIYIGISGSVMLFVQVLGLALLRLRSSRSRVNKRLDLLDNAASNASVLLELRRDRGLSDTSAIPLVRRINRLFVQSGMGSRRLVFLLVLLLVSFTGLFVLFLMGVVPLPALPVGLVVVVGLLFLAVIGSRNRRRARFAEQLPEALDIMVRSIQAGHPIPIAVALVSRELGDPIGSEFGIAADEMTYGMDLEGAMQNLSSRVGEQDLPFLVVAVSIQSKTGGNLAEVLSKLSRVIRDRFKLRRRVTAMSSEGRWSAGALSLIPLLIFVAINLIAPKFYGDVKDDPIIFPVATITLFVWATGIYIIHRLVNFRY